MLYDVVMEKPWADLQSGGHKRHAYTGWQVHNSLVTWSSSLTNTIGVTVNGVKMEKKDWKAQLLVMQVDENDHSISDTAPIKIQGTVGQQGPTGKNGIKRTSSVQINKVRPKVRPATVPTARVDDSFLKNLFNKAIGK